MTWLSTTFYTNKPKDQSHFPCLALGLGPTPRFCAGPLKVSCFFGGWRGNGLALQTECCYCICVKWTCPSTCSETFYIFRYSISSVNTRDTRANLCLCFKVVNQVDAKSLTWWTRLNGSLNNIKPHLLLRKQSWVKKNQEKQKSGLECTYVL